MKIFKGASQLHKGTTLGLIFASSLFILPANLATAASTKTATSKVQISTPAKVASTPQGQAEEILANLIDGTNYRSPNPGLPMRNSFSTDSVASLRLRYAYERMEERRQQQSVSPDLRSSSVAKLQALGPSIAPFLASQLNSPSSIVTSVCAEVLGKLGTDATAPLMQQLRDHGQNQNIQQALRQIGVDAMPPLVTMLKSSKETERLAAADTINSLLPAGLQPMNFAYPQANAIVLSGKLVDAICDATINEKAVKVRLLETQILGKIGPRHGVTDAFIKLADTDEEPLVRGSAITAIGAIAAKESDQTAEPYITKLAGWAKNDEFDGCRIAAINAMGQAKKSSEIAVPALTAMLEDKRTDIANAALTSLSKFGDKASSALPALLKIAEQNTDSQETYLALQTIGHLGADAKPAFNLLIKDISSPNKNLQRGSFHALQALARDGNIDLTSNIPKLLELMSTDDFSTRWEIIQLFEAMGPQAAPAKESLMQLMEKYPQDKSRVQMALRKISEHNP